MDILLKENKDLCKHKHITIKKSTLEKLETISKNKGMNHSFIISQLIEAYYEDVYINKK